MKMLKFAFLTCLFWCAAHAERFSGLKNPLTETGDYKNFAFMAMFCAGTQAAGKEAAAFDITVRLKEGVDKGQAGNLYVAMYADFADGKADYTYENARTDSEKCKDVTKDGDTKPNWQWNARGNPEKVEFNDKNTWTKSIPIYEHLRPHFWYVILVNCVESDTKEPFEFEVHATQSDVSSWDTEFGRNIGGLNLMYLIFTILYGGLFVVQILAARSYSSAGGVHHIVKLLLMAIFFQFVSIFLLCINWFYFQGNGMELGGVVISSNVCAILAQTTFMMQLLLMGQGWLISKTSVSFGKVILFGTCGYAFLMISLFLWQWAVSNSDETQFFFSTAPYIIAAGVLFGVGCFFGYSTYGSYSEEPDDEKRGLYCKLASFYFIWFSSPVISIILGIAISPWARDVVAVAVNETCTFVWLGIMVLLLHPSNAEKYFEITVGPYAPDAGLPTSADYGAYNKMGEAGGL